MAVGRRLSWLKTCLLLFLALCGLSLLHLLSAIHTTTITTLYRLLLHPVPSTPPSLQARYVSSVGRPSVSSDVSSGPRDVRPDDVIQTSPPASLPSCPDVPPNLVGYKPPEQGPQPLSVLETRWKGVVREGGDYRPPDCRAKNRTAIIISCRNRWAHLRTLLNHLIPFLIRQQVSFTFFVVEPDQASHFNKGILLNAGYLEALKYDNYTCFVFQDVDLLPLNDRNLYRCGAQPRHLAAAIDKFNYRLPYRDFFGGVLALSREQVEKVNGHSNVYFGWGGEDDDIMVRIYARGYTISRLPLNVTQYKMLQHARDAGNEETEQKLPLVSAGEVVKRMGVEGVRQAVYERDWVTLTPLFTWVKVTVNETRVIESFPDNVRQRFEEGLKLRKPPLVYKANSSARVYKARSSARVYKARSSAHVYKAKSSPRVRATPSGLHR